MTNAPERIWLSAADDDNEREIWTDPDEGGTEYTRSDIAAKMETDNKRLREALEPFAYVAEHDIGDYEDDSDTFWPISNASYSTAGRLRVGHLRAASRALGGNKDD